MVLTLSVYLFVFDSGCSIDKTDIHSAKFTCCSHGSAEKTTCNHVH